MQDFRLFWNRAPALLYGLVVLIATCLAIHGNLLLLFPLGLLFLPFIKEWNRLMLLLALGSVTFFYVNTSYSFPKLPPEGIKGTGYFEISSLTNKRSSYGSKWVYQGRLKFFCGYKNIPCSISLPQKGEMANQAYYVSGTLKKTVKGNIYFALDKKVPWKAIKGTWSLAEVRYKAKKVVTDYILNHIKSRRSADFLSGIATGNFEDPLMFNEFSRFGLQHIMAISGFHFAIIASILGLSLRMFIKEKISTPLLILFLSSYFFFLGDSPSIIRAFITILVALIGIAFEKRVFGLNSLGVATLFIILYDPLMSSSIGFQFSTLSTAAILLFFPIFNRLLAYEKPLHQMVQMSLLDQHGYTLLATFKQALALGLAVNIVAIPAMLFYFQKFPTLSLLFNLFFPFLVSISMLLLIVALFLGPLGGVVHVINSYYTEFALNFLYGMPPCFDQSFQTDSLTAEFLLIYITLTFTGGVILNHKLKNFALSN